MNPPLPPSKLTDTLIAKLPFASSGQYLVRDQEQAGFFVVVGKRSKTYTVQGDLRSGRSRKTLRLAIGRHDDPAINARSARATAREWLGRIARGENPAEPKPGAGYPTLADAWARYEESHLKRKGRDEKTIATYRDDVQRVMKHWLETPLMELGQAPKKVADFHDKLTREGHLYKANRAMRTLRALYNHARKYAPELPTTNPCSLLDWNQEKRRNTAMGSEDLSAWHKQLTALPNPVRREFHWFSLLSGSRPEALSQARWEHVDPRRRVLHIPRPKGGERKAFDIPLSSEMIRTLWRARRAGRLMYPAQAAAWVFPALSRSGHIEEHKEDRKLLSKWGNDLRQTYRTMAQAAGLAELDTHLLMNHSLPGVNAGYITRGKLGPHLREQQETLSTFIIDRCGRGKADVAR